VKRRAPARAGEDRAYAALRAELLPGPCEVCAPLIAAGEALTEPVRLECAGRATELHHRRKRSSSGALANRDNVVRSCHDGNMAVEHYPVQAEHAGLVVREGHPEWDALSSRTWRLAQL
jgi:hypothetical protein